MTDLVVGVPAESGGLGLDRAGRAYVFSGATGVRLATLVSNNQEAGAEFGYSVASGGDLDGDGRADVIVGAPLEDSGVSDAGRVYAFDGLTGVRIRSYRSASRTTART